MGDTKEKKRSKKDLKRSKKESKKDSKRSKKNATPNTNLNQNGSGTIQFTPPNREQLQVARANLIPLSQSENRKNRLPSQPVNSESNTGKNIPPSYETIKEGYKEFRNKAQKCAEGNTHAKKDEYDELINEKADLDVKYKIAMRRVSRKNTSENKEAEEDKIENDKKIAMREMHDAADSEWITVDRKLSKNIKAHEDLERYRDGDGDGDGERIMEVIKHAGKLHKNDSQITETPDTVDTENENPENENEKKSKKRKKPKMKEKKAGKLTNLVKYLNKVLQMGDGAKTQLESWGEGTEKIKETLDKAKLLPKETKSTVGVEQYSPVAVVMAMVLAAVSFYRITKGVCKFMQNQKRNMVSKHEKWQRSQEILNNIYDGFTNMVTAVKPFADVLPFFGPTVGILNDGVGLMMNSRRLKSGFDKADDMQREKERLWKEIERKRNKYKRSGDAVFFEVGSSKRDSSKIDDKRRVMLETVSREMGIEKKEKTKEDSRNTSEYADAEKNISTRISQLREEMHKPGQRMNISDNKRKMHAMEALELMSQYRTAEKAKKKMDKLKWHAFEKVITTAEGLAGNAVLLVGQIIANPIVIAAGEGMVKVRDAYELGRLGVSLGYKGIRKAIGSTANKENTRNEMAEYIFDKMIALNPPYAKWDKAGKFFDMSADVPDYKIREERDEIKELHSTLRRGVDARMDFLLNARTSKEMKKVLHRSFAQVE